MIAGWFRKTPRAVTPPLTAPFALANADFTAVDLAGASPQPADRRRHQPERTCIIPETRNAPSTDWLRSVTLRMDRRRPLAISKMVSRVLTPLDRAKLYRQTSILRLLNFFARLEPHHHMLFDWYSAPHADRHRPGELAGWFENNGIEIVKSSWDERSFSAIQKLRRRVLPDWGMGARGELVRPRFHEAVTGEPVAGAQRGMGR